MPAIQVAAHLLSVIKAPFSLYFELTIADPYREVSRVQGCRQMPKKITRAYKAAFSAAYRFSLFELIRKQRAAVSPKLGENQPTRVSGATALSGGLTEGQP